MSGIYGARLAQKSSRISREESARATGDVDERAFGPPSSKEEKTRRKRERGRENERGTEKRDTRQGERGREREKHRASDGRPGILHLAFKIRNRREAGEVLMTLAGPGPRWRNGREVEVHGRRRAQTAVSTDSPDLPHAILEQRRHIATRRHPPPSGLPHYHTAPSCLPFARSRTPARARASVSADARDAPMTLALSRRHDECTPAAKCVGIIKFNLIIKIYRSKNYIGCILFLLSDYYVNPRELNLNQCYSATNHSTTN